MQYLTDDKMINKDMYNEYIIASSDECGDGCMYVSVHNTRRFCFKKSENRGIHVYRNMNNVDRRKRCTHTDSDHK